MLPGGLRPTSQWALRLHGRLGRQAREGLVLGADELTNRSGWSPTWARSTA